MNTSQATSSDYPLQFCVHHWVKNERVAMRVARKIWPKIFDIIDFWKGLLESKKPGKGKIGVNYFCLIQKNQLVALKLQFFEDIAKTLILF